MQQNENPLNDKEKNMLLSAYENIQEPPQLRSKITAALYEKGLLKKNLSFSWIRFGVAVMAAGLIFFAGWRAAKPSTNQKQQVMANNEKKIYMLLLHNSPGFIDEYEKQVKEYGDWMRDLIKKGTVSGGDELADGGWLIQPAGYSTLQHDKDDASGPVSGYFVIETNTEEEAIAIAQSCPHIKYNGSIELRAVVRQQ
jgi:YCII-related domain